MTLHANFHVSMLIHSIYPDDGNCNAYLQIKKKSYKKMLIMLTNKRNIHKVQIATCSDKRSDRPNFEKEMQKYKKINYI